VTTSKAPSVFVERVLKLPKKGTVRISVFAPERDASDPNGDWICRYQATGGDVAITSRAHGVDSLQALIEALRGVRHELEPFASKLSWLSGQLGDTGLPLIAPYDDPDFVAVLDASLELEHARRLMYLRALERPKPRRKRK
jgi:hypothetical protein